MPAFISPATYIDPNKNAVLDGSDTGWKMFRVSTPVTDQTLTQMATPFATAPVTTQTAPDAYEQIVDYVGNWWWARDAIDSRVISNVTNFTGVPIGAAAPIASELTALLATPHDHSRRRLRRSTTTRMHDAWETLHGGNLVWNADFDNDGYINLIEFINEKGEFPAPAPIVFNGSAQQSLRPHHELEDRRRRHHGRLELATVQV